MDHHPDNILSYASKPNRWPGLRAISRRTWITLAVFAFLLFAAYSFLQGPTSGQIRLDTGDLRYCWWGIPLEYRQMPEPQRSKLLALAGRAPAIPAKWVTCTTSPQSPEYRPDRSDRNFYFSTAIWSDEDPTIARWAMDDVVDYIQHAKWGLPQSVHLLSPETVNWQTDSVNAGWRNQDDVKQYCATHEYVPPPAPTVSAPR